LVTAIPMLAVGATTLTAGWQSIWNNFSRDPSRVKAIVNSGCTAILMGSCLLVLFT
jgi:ABC-type sulfate transport system permease component